MTPAAPIVYQRLGIPTVATVRWTADQMLRRLLPEGAEPLLARPDRGHRAGRGGLHRGWLGEKVSALEDMAQTRIAFISRLGQAMIPNRGTVIQEGDVLHVVAEEGDLQRIAALFCRPVHGQGRALMRVAIAGAGAVGMSIASELIENGHEVLLIDKDPKAIRVYSVPAPSGCWPTRARSPRWTTPSSSGATWVIAATGDDKANLVTSLLAKTEYGVPGSWPGSTCPPTSGCSTSRGRRRRGLHPRLLSALVEEAVSVGDLVRLMTFRQSDATLVEMTMPADAPLAGQRVGDIDWPADTALVAIPARRPGDRAQQRRTRWRAATSCCS